MTASDANYTFYSKRKQKHGVFHIFTAHKNKQVSIFSIMPEVFCWLCDMQVRAYLSSYVKSCLGSNVGLGPNFGEQLDQVSLFKNNMIKGLKSGKLQLGWELGIGCRRLWVFNIEHRLELDNRALIIASRTNLESGLRFAEVWLGYKPKPTNSNS